MGALSYTVKIGDITCSADPRSTEAILGALRVRRSIGGAVGEARVTLRPLGLSAPMPGDPVEITLDAGEGEHSVFVGEVLGLSSGLLGLTVFAADGLAKLAALDTEGVFEGQSVGAIVGELLGEAGLDKGTLDEGPTLPRVTLHRGPRALKHAIALARRGGLELWTDGEGKVWMQGPDAEGDEVELAFGKNLVALELGRSLLVPDGWEIFGEGAASGSGAERAHWLPTKLDSVRASAAVTGDNMALQAEAGGEGERAVRVVDGALRSGELAESAARARAEARAARAVHGHADLIGGVGVGLGARVTVVALPKGHASEALVEGPLRVRGLVHRLDRRSGLLTRLEF